MCVCASFPIFAMLSLGRYLKVGNLSQWINAYAICMCQITKLPATGILPFCIPTNNEFPHRICCWTFWRLSMCYERKATSVSCSLHFSCERQGWGSSNVSRTIWVSFSVPCLLISLVHVSVDLWLFPSLVRKLFMGE